MGKKIEGEILFFFLFLGGIFKFLFSGRDEMNEYKK